MALHATHPVKQRKTMSWNKEFLVYVSVWYFIIANQRADKLGFDSVGNNSSTISLVLVENASKYGPQGPYIACVNIVIGTMLALCADSECMLEIYNLLRYLMNGLQLLLSKWYRWLLKHKWGKSW